MRDRHDFVVKAEFAAGADHAVGLDAAQGAFMDRHAAFDLGLAVERTGYVAAVECDRHLDARFDVRRAADDLDRRFLADIHHADGKALCIGMLFAFDDFTDDNAFDAAAGVVDFFQVGTGHDHLGHVFVGIHLDICIIFQPCNGY